MRTDKKQYEAPKIELLYASIGMSLSVSGDPSDSPIDDPWIKF